jgi:hypothetical protein
LANLLCNLFYHLAYVGVPVTLAPWCANEAWELFQRDGKTIARVTGREPCPSELKSNIVWWFRNDYEQNLASAPWFEPGFPQDQRERDWAARNPLQNARLFVWGWADRNYEVEVLEGRLDMPLLVQRDDIGEVGYQRSQLTLLDGSAKTGFTSYASPKLLWYYGTQPTGFFGVKFVPRPFA